MIHSDAGCQTPYVRLSKIIERGQKEEESDSETMTAALHVKKTRALFVLYASESGGENRRRNKGMKTKERTRTEGSRPRRDWLDETKQKNKDGVSK